MKFIGAHVSAAGGVSNTPISAHEMGATAFSLFTKNQKQWSAPDLKEDEILKFKDNIRKFGFPPESILVHDSYLINMGNPEPEKRSKSIESFINEVHRCEQLGLKLINFHPGAHLKKITRKQCLGLIVEALNSVIKQTNKVILVIENTAGQGSQVGNKWEDLGEIIKMTEDKSRIGICIDSCHAFAAGYDLVNDYEKIFQEFEDLIGFQYLKGMYLNDAKRECGSRIDRHESIGKGFIGEDFFKRVMGDSRFNGIPYILETPNHDIWPEEIAKLKKWAGLII